MSRDNRRTRPSIPQTRKKRRPRLVMEANCARCNSLSGACKNPWSAAKLATEHTARTGHVVLLTGTADIPDQD
jgi:hypothetical protein